MTMPGMKTIDHIGITVPDIDEACDFFDKILGGRTLYTAATNIMDDQTDWMYEQFNVNSRSIIRELRFLELPDGSILEIFDYYAPDQKSDPPKNSDIGGHHLAFYVEDIYEAIRFLKENGVHVQSEPVVYDDGPKKGTACCYFLSPWGMQLELVSN